MTVLVHTADVHLSPAAPERLDALVAVLDRAEAADAAVVTVGGDLFDTPRDLEALRTRLRNRTFADRAVDVVVVPGNHDVEAFRGDLFFGDACTVLLDEPYGVVTVPERGLRVVGVPYRERADEDLLLALGDREPFDGVDVLLVHCTLDVDLGFQAMGEEATRRYLPLTPAELAELGFDVVLAGHHHQPRTQDLDEGMFVYPGTPASTRRSEVGPRRLATVDRDGRVALEPLEAFHHAHLEVDVMPDSEAEAIDRVRTWWEETVTPRTEPRVTVRGFHGRDEAAFNRTLGEAATPEAVADETRSVQRIRAHPLYQTFEECLAGRDLDAETTEAIRRVTLEAFASSWEAIR